MVRMILEDDCLAPAGYVEVKYTGPNPFRAYLITSDELKRILGIRKKDIWEREFRWDISGDPRSFYARIYARKRFDAITYAFLEIEFFGHQPIDPKKAGSVTIRIGGKLKTKFGGTTVFTHPKNPLYQLWVRLYLSLFYAKIRRLCLTRCRGYVMSLRQRYMEVLGIKK